MAKAQRKEDDVKVEAATAPESAAPADAPWQPPTQIGRVSLAVIIGVVLLINLPMLHYFLWRSPMKATQALPFTDDYSNAATVPDSHSRSHTAASAGCATLPPLPSLCSSRIARRAGRIGSLSQARM